MKVLIILGALAFLALLIYRAVKPYLATARRFLSFVRDVRRMSAGGTTVAGAPRPANTEVKKLVRCASCGVWLPAARALALRSSAASYCSHACLERAAEQSGGQRTTRRNRQA